MTRLIVQTANRTYLFSPDDPPALGGRPWAVVKLRVIDELTAAPPISSVTIQAKEPGLFPHASSDGIVGLVGIPRSVFPLLKTRIYTLHLTVGADGYTPQQVEAKLGPQGTFPATFTPHPTINLALHREPVVITGRTVRADGITTIPVANATVEIIGVWRTPPAFNASIPPDPPNLVAIRPPLYRDRKPTIGQVQDASLLPVGGDDKLLLDDLQASAQIIRLSNRKNLLPGGLLLIDADQPDLKEVIAITAIQGGASPDDPASITLDFGLAYAHRRQALVNRVAPPLPGAVEQFNVEGLAGDTCVLLKGVAGLATATEVQISGGAVPNEYHSLSRFSVTSDADGYYRLPPLSRVALVKLSARKKIGPQTFAAELEFRPDYALRENRLDLTLTV